MIYHSGAIYTHLLYWLKTGVSVRMPSALSVLEILSATSPANTKNDCYDSQ